MNRTHSLRYRGYLKDLGWNVVPTRNHLHLFSKEKLLSGGKGVGEIKLIFCDLFRLTHL